MESVKVLGVSLDSGLKWEHHIATIVRRCYCVLIGLARIRCRVPRETRRLLVEALVFPHLQYCMCVWGSCSATQKRRLQKCINFAARVVSGLGYRQHVSGTLRELGWSDVGNMLRKRDMLTMYRLVHDENAPELLRSRIVSRADVSTRSTRSVSDGHLEVPRARTEFARRSFFIRAIRTWNGLTPATRSSPTMATFKRCITNMSLAE